MVHSKDNVNYQRKKNAFISIIVPVFDEEESVKEFYNSIKIVLDSITNKWEIVYVDDGSGDDTFNLLLNLHDADKRVKLIKLSRNFGKELALTAGLQYAKGDVIIPIDVDLQDPPELIPDMLKLWSKGNDVVYATRIERTGESWLKKVTAELFYKIIGSISSVEIPKNTGDFRLIDRRVLTELNKLKETNRFMKGLFSWVGFRQISIPYVRNPRLSGKTKWSYFKLFNLAADGIVSFSVSPLRLATFSGVIISLGSISYAVIILLKTLFYGVDVPGYASLLLSILFLGSLQLIFIGIVGEYVGKIFNEVKGRPLYIVDEEIGL